LLALAVAGTALGSVAVATNTAGAGDIWQRIVKNVENGELFSKIADKIDRFLAGPPPDRPTLETVDASDEPDDSPEPPPTPTPSLEPGQSAPPTPVPTPKPTLPPRVAVDVDIVQDHDAVFAHEIRVDWCAPAGVEMVLAIWGKGAPTEARQRELASRVGEWESWKDSHNGEWGPAAMALALEAYGVPGYEIRAYGSRRSALRGAAQAIAKTHAPAILLAWRGAHTWIMTGYRADADPTVFKDANVTGAYILDPWYPDISSIWGPSDPPGTFQNAAEMERNFLVWHRPEGQYPDRDGKFIVVIPTIARG
jgi:hypothetical protein